MHAPALAFKRFWKERDAPPRRAAFAVAAALVLAAAPLPALSWIIPGIANTPGVNGVTFFSDLTAVNPSGAELRITLTLIPGPGTFNGAAKSYIITGTATLRLTNVLGTVWAQNGTGALRVTADSPVRLFVRTYAVPPVPSIPEAPPPTFGTALPVLEETSLLQTGETGHSPWATQAAETATGPRTNVAVAFPDDGGGAANVTLFDGQGQILGSVSFESSRPAFLQRSLASFAAAPVVAGRIAVSVTRGRACGYTATADAGTGDLTILLADRLPARFHAMVSSGVAQLPGSNGAFWQTEARLANPDERAVALTAFFLGGPRKALQVELLVPGGRTVAARSIVSSLFGFSDAAAGEVLWMADGPLVIATRTSSPVTLPAPGSAGEGRAAIAVADFLTFDDGSADLGDVRSGAFSRSNLFVAAGPEGAAYKLEARDETGRDVGSYRGTLPVLGWAEFRAADLFPASGDRIVVRVLIESGSANVQAGVVDAVTNDLVLYEASPRAVLSPTPPLPAGVWGSPEGTEGIQSDLATIFVEKFCRSGPFDQPARLDAMGKFSTLGRFIVNVGPAMSVAAILAGQTDGRTVTFSISDLLGLIQEEPVTYILGKPYRLPPGACPVEY